MKILIKNINTLCQTSDGLKFLKGKEMDNLSVIKNSFLSIKSGLIDDFGEMNLCPEEHNFNDVIDAQGKFVMPCFVDSHTHIVFAATREEEFLMRLKGKTYEEIATAGGGILNSARKLQNTPEEKLLEDALMRLSELIKLGTGAIEIKSGYGLSTASEIKMLKVIKSIKEKNIIPVKANFLGAHAFPMEYRQNRTAYIKQITDDMLPLIQKENLADYIDVFCEEGFFSTEETDFILKKGVKYGLKPKIHANQLSVSGGVQVGVANAAVSVDHLEQITDAEITCLKNSSTIPTLLPSCSFFIGIPYAPARKLIDSGLGVVLASDYNPGSTPSGNMQFVCSLGSIKLKMTPNEVLNAVTINASHALELQHSVGSISKGKIANLIITKSMENLALLNYSFGSNLVEKVMVNGKIYN